MKWPRKPRVEHRISAEISEVIANNNFQRASSFWASGALMLLAILLGVLAGTDAVWSLFPLLLLIVMPILLIVTRRFQDSRGRLLLWAWSLMLVATGAQQAIHIPLGYLIELTLFPLILAVLAFFWREAARDRWLALMLAFWLVYFVLSVLSTLLGRSHALPAIWQLQYNLKWPLMFGLGCLIVWGAPTESHLRRILAFSWILLGGCVALEIAWVGGHTLIFGPPPDLHGNPLIGVGLRYRGPFQHSGYLAITAGLLACGAAAQFMNGRGMRWLVVSAIYAALVMLSGQRQEALAMVLTFVLFALLAGRRYWSIIVVAGFVAVSVGVLAILQLDEVPMRAVFAQWGLVDSTASLSERAILTLRGVEVARAYFPLGSGLGTYGGAGAQKFDQSQFIELGFMSYWWFRQGMFLVDTFWPNVIAESGFVAAIFMLLAFVALWAGLLRRCLIVSRGSANYALSLTAFAAATLLLANSPSSAVLTDPRGAFLLWLLIGMGWRVCDPASVCDQLASYRKQDSCAFRTSEKTP